MSKDTRFCYGPTPMKKLLYFLSLCLLVPTKSFGWKEFHGGDHVKIQWSILAATIMADTDKVPTLRKYSNLFLDIYFNTKIITTDDNLSLDGVSKVALFEIDHETYEKTLYIQVSSWEKLTDTEKEYLVIHELLNISGLIDDDYYYSQDLFLKLKMARPILEKYGSLFNYVFEGFNSCQIENFNSLISLLVEKASLNKIIENIDLNPNYCANVKKLSEKLRSLNGGVSNDE